MARWCLCVAVGVVALAIAGQAGAQPRALRQRAHLSLTDRNPVKVRGAGFRSHEHVTVVGIIGPGQPITRHVRASSAGGFAASLRGHMQPCGGGRITATGSRGSVAVLHLNLPRCIAD
jgi:hypothetical protein